MENVRELVNFLLEKDLRLKYLEDQILDNENKEEIFEILGEFEIVDWDERKDRRNCIETAVVHFKKYDLYLKEVAVGECHYKDVMIDGWPHEIDYFLVDPQVSVTYGNDRLV
jgi:hypothetical protein